MNNLEQLFYSADTGFVDVNKLYNMVKDKGVTLAQVKQWYDSQSVNQLFKQVKPVFQKIKCPFDSIGCLQIDLMQIDKFFRQNAGYHYIFNCIDIYSSYWVYPIKNKQASSTVEPMKIIIDEIRKLYPKNIITVTVDKGSEFFKPFSTYLKEQNIRIYYNDLNKPSAKTHMAIVECCTEQCGALLKNTQLIIIH